MLKIAWKHITPPCMKNFVSLFSPFPFFFSQNCIILHFQHNATCGADVFWGGGVGSHLETGNQNIQLRKQIFYQKRTTNVQSTGIKARRDKQSHSSAARAKELALGTVPSSAARSQLQAQKQVKKSRLGKKRSSKRPSCCTHNCHWLKGNCIKPAQWFTYCLI